MVKTSLVEHDIEDGKRLIEVLNATPSGGHPYSHFRIQAAFWLYSPESLSWKLVIATPLIDQRGPFETYTDIQGALRFMTPPLAISLQDISVVSPNDNLVKLVKKAVRVPPGVQGVRFTHDIIDNTYIEDAYIYRLQRAA